MNKKLQKELQKGGWKPMNDIFKIGQNKKIRLLFGDGKVKNAEWFPSMNWLKYKKNSESVVGWKMKEGENEVV